MAGKKDLEEFVRDMRRTPGWTVPDAPNGAGHWTFTNDETGESVTMSSTPSSVRTLANTKAELRRKGWDEEAFKRAKEADRAERLAADKLKGEKAMADAIARAAKATAELAAPVASQFIPAQVPIIITPTAPEVPMASARNIRALFEPHRDRDPEQYDLYWVTPELADAALEKGPCAQRRVSDTNVARITRAINTGRFYKNPADHILFDVHGCASNGQHRLYSILDADPDALKEHYPNGVPLYVKFGFNPEHMSVVDTGKSRDANDALTVAGEAQFGKQGAAVLRLIMNFDKGLPWTHWNKEVWINDDFTEAAKGGLKEVADYLNFAQTLYRKAGLNKTVGAAAAFLIDRDNPGGGAPDRPERTNQEFWDGVCFEVALAPNDPRAALYKYLKGLKDDKTRTAKTPVLLGHVLRQYANWHLGNTLSMSRQDDDWPIPAVWQPGMRFIAGKLKHPERAVKPKTAPKTTKK
jgi:hypothetical protein